MAKSLPLGRVFLRRIFPKTNDNDLAVSPNPPMDTVKLKTLYTLPATNPHFKEKVKTKDLDLYEMKISGNRFVYSNQTWRKERQKMGIYTPKYWIEEDFVNPKITYLALEFSVPKLLFGENLTEVSDINFPAIVKKLQEFLVEISIYMTTKQIENMMPILFAVGKNLNITDMCSCDIAIRSLSPFNNRFRSDYRVIEFENDRGKELYFSNKNTTFKIYEKVPEMIANASTKEERKLVDVWVQYSKSKYQKDKVLAVEILRFELTLKTKVAINQIMKKYGVTSPTFKDIFKKEIWDELVKKEIEKIYNQPLTNFVFLATNKKPVIDAFLDKNYKSIRTKDTVRGLLQSLQEKGLADTKRHFMQTYSRKTWYNYMERLDKIEKIVDFSQLKNLTSVEIHSHILKEFGINSSVQTKLDI